MIISGDHEYRAQTLADIEVDRETGTLEEMKAVFVENVTNAIDGVTGDPAVTDALAFIVTRNSANQISARLMEAKKSVCPANADLNPQNARIVHSTGSVYYSEDGPFETNLFSQFEEIFKVGNK